MPAALADQTITSSGPLTSIGISSDLNCSVNHTGDASGEFYGNTACGTFVTSGGNNYGPASVPAGNAGNPAYTPVSQSAVTGSGTNADPYTIVTVVDLGTSGLRLTETDSYVIGSESYRTDVSIKNNGASSASAIVYRAGDCFLQDSDTGYGSVDAGTGAVSCVNAVPDPSGGTVPGTRIEQWYPLTPASHYMEGKYSDVWAATVAGSHFPDSCTCSTELDNGGGLSWDATIPAGGTVTDSSLITFSPLGHQPLTTTKTADSASATASTPDGYTIKISNPNNTSVSLDSISDTLPTGFAYAAGSSTGATTSDPTVSGQTLTWSGPITVPAASGGSPGTATLHFGVTVAGATGTYYNNAGGTASGYTVIATGDTAPVTVTSGSGDAGISGTGTDFNPTEGQPLSGQTVATFSDPDTSSTAGEYSAMIDWGDGHTSAGTVSGSAGSFTVKGDHTYAEHGSYSVHVTITDSDNSANTLTTSATAAVADASLDLTATPVSGTEGQAFTGTAGTFTDGDPAATASEYSATIDWGDGHTSSGTVSGSAGSFTVTGAHTYAEKGSYPVKVTVAEADNAATSQSSAATAAVGDAGLTAAGKGTLNSGASFSGAVATFTDTNTAAPLSDFTATIDWADGHTSAGTVNGGGGSYSVSGSHAYPGSGSYAVTVTIRDVDGSQAGATTTIAITPANSPPRCSAVAGSPSVLWPPNDRFVLVTLNGATDPNGDPLTYTIMGVQQDAPVWVNDDEAPDAKTGPTPNSVFLRADKDGARSGRLYFIAFTVSDGHGGTCSGTVTIAVPRHHLHRVVDTGGRFDSFATPPPPPHHHHHHHHH